MQKPCHFRGLWWTSGLPNLRAYKLAGLIVPKVKHTCFVKYTIQNFKHMHKQDFILNKLINFQDFSNETRILCSEALQIQASTFD